MSREHSPVSATRRRVARRVRELRERINLDQTGLARRAGLTTAYIAALEREERVSLAYIPRIAEALNVEYTSLLSCTID